MQGELENRQKGFLNWCEHDKTVLANEQVVDGCCWRCGTQIVKKEMYQYYLKISDYADELLNDLDLLEQGWPKQVITMQKNWIGKSTGLEFDLYLDEKSKQLLGEKFEKFGVFTTRADTIYGVSYTALAPEHELVSYMIENNLLSSLCLCGLQILFLWTMEAERLWLFPHMMREILILQKSMA